MKSKHSTKSPGLKATRPPASRRAAAGKVGADFVVPVRAAKARLSALLELVAEGRQVTITSDGVPKAVLSPVGAGHRRKRFAGMGDFLLSQPVHGGMAAEEVVRQDRDARGW